MATLCPLTYSLDNVVAPGAEVWGGADRKGEGGGEGREGGYINMKSVTMSERAILRAYDGSCIRSAFRRASERATVRECMRQSVFAMLNETCVRE